MTAARDRGAYLWDLKTGRQIAKLVTENGEGEFGDQFEFRFIGSGKLVLIAAAQSTLRGWIWDSATGKLVRRIEGYAGVTRKDGQDKIIRLVAGKVRISNLDGQDELQFGHDFTINNVSDLQVDFEKGLAIVGGRIAETPGEIWDIKDDVLVGSLEKISNSGSGPGFQLGRDAAEILTEGSDGDAKLWNEKSGVSLTTLVAGNDKQVMDEALFGAGDDSVLVNWKADTEVGVKLAETTVWTLNRVWKLQLRSPGRSAAFSPDGSRILVTAEDNSARIWRVTGKTIAAELKGHTGTIVDADFSSSLLLAWATYRFIECPVRLSSNRLRRTYIVAACIAVLGACGLGVWVAGGVPLLFLGRRRITTATSNLAILATRPRLAAPAPQVRPIVIPSPP